MTVNTLHRKVVHSILLLVLISFPLAPVLAQALGAGTVGGTVVDPNNAVVPNANVTIANPITGYTRSVVTNQDGTFRFDNVPRNNYQLSISASGFSPATQNVTVRTSVPITLKVALTIGESTETVTVTGGTADVLENVPSAHVDVDKTLIDRLPLRDPGSGLSTAVTLAAPGIAADSNGGFHPLGDHFESNISLDNQPISDQQSKFFSTQVPVNIIQSMEVITGAAPPEFGDKTSLIINAITRSGLNQKKPTGSFNVLYGTFGTTHEDAALAYGNAKGGNFVAFNFDRSGRFLDAPEFSVLHDRGTAGRILRRAGYIPQSKGNFPFHPLLSPHTIPTPNLVVPTVAWRDPRQTCHTMQIVPT